MICDRVIVSDSFSNLSPYGLYHLAHHQRVEYLLLESAISVSRICCNRSVNEWGHATSLTKSRTNKLQWCRVQKLTVSFVTLTHLFIFNENAGPSQAEQLLRVTSGIAAELIKAHDANESVSLNEIRARISKKYAFGGVPRLVDIISAIPDEYKKALLPKLKARPIRTASGVSGSYFFCVLSLKLTR